MDVVGFRMRLFQCEIIKILTLEHLIKSLREWGASKRVKSSVILVASYNSQQGQLQKNNISLIS